MNIPAVSAPSHHRLGRRRRSRRPPIGFVLLTHQHPAQVARLVGLLDAMFEHPPIACHHDFSKCALPRERFGANVSFLTPHLETSWAHWSVVEATGRCIEMLYADPAVAPEWFVVLSGADYPIKPAETILADLRSSVYDAHIGHQQIDRRVFDAKWCEAYWAQPRRAGEHPIDPGACYGRYRTISVPFPTWRLTIERRTLYKPVWTTPFLPFSRTLECHAGSQWFCGNARAAARIIEFRRHDTRLARHYSGRKFAEESYFQTILANDPTLRLSTDNLRYTDWSERGSHPSTLTTVDMPALQASTAHFARKLDPNASASLMDALDAHVLLPAAARPQHAARRSA